MLSHHQISSLLLLTSTAVLVAQSTRRVRRQAVDTVDSVDYPTYSTIPDGLSFTCTDRIPGYYADPEAQCQVWHWCLPEGQMYSFLCPNQTMFNQLYRVCDWYYNVDCDGSADSYNINEDLYKIPDGNNNVNEGRNIDDNNGNINDINNDVTLTGDVGNIDYFDGTVIDDGLIPAENNNGFGAIINEGGDASGNVGNTAITFDDNAANINALNNNNGVNEGRSISTFNDLGVNVNFANYDYDFGSRISGDNSGFGAVIFNK